jgi:hypothetical protein
VTTQLRTSRGVYRLAIAAPRQVDQNDQILTLALERADGIERVVFRCRIALELIGPNMEHELLVARLTPWLEREFERVREAALKAIRTERKLFDLAFNREHPGPFAASLK